MGKSFTHLGAKFLKLHGKSFTHGAKSFTHLPNLCGIIQLFCEVTNFVTSSDAAR